MTSTSSANMTKRTAAQKNKSKNKLKNREVVGPASPPHRPPTSPPALPSKPFAALVEEALASTSKISPSPSGSLFAASLSTPPSTSPFALKETTLIPSLDAQLSQSNGLAPALALTLSPAEALPMNSKTEDSLPPGANFTGPFRLFDLAQELQDTIFEFAYTEPDFTIVYKSTWEDRQQHLRNTGKPKVGSPNHKVNEWMVSKNYFRTAAKAWVEAQTSFEFVRCQLKGRSLSSHELFPPMVDTNEGAGLFLEFGRTFVVDMHAPDSVRGSIISRCRRVQNVIGVVWEQYFDMIDRGLAWEIEFTEEELVGLLERATFTLPSSVEKMHLQDFNLRLYANTDAKRAVFKANVAHLERLLWQRKAKDPQPDECVDLKRMYLFSAVMSSTPSKVVDSGEDARSVSRDSAPMDPEHSLKQLDDEIARIDSQLRERKLKAATEFQEQLSKTRVDESRREAMLKWSNVAFVMAALHLGFAAFSMWEEHANAALKAAALSYVELIASVVFRMFS
jgi:hypothetical protein